MIVTKGLEIIPKRDKVTYASNITGKWEDYSIETYQGKVLKDAVERFKIMLKEGKSLENEAPSLKEMFNKSDIKPIEVQPVDLWDMPVVHEPVVINEAAEINAIELTKVLIEKKKELPLQQVRIATDAFKHEVSSIVEGKMYLILAGETKTGRQQYINIYNDCDRWDISVVPCPITANKVSKIYKRVLSEYKDKMLKNTLLAKRGVPDIQFKIEEYVDIYAEDTKKK